VREGQQAQKLAQSGQQSPNVTQAASQQQPPVHVPQTPAHEHQAAKSEQQSPRVLQAESQ